MLPERIDNKSGSAKCGTAIIRGESMDIVKLIEEGKSVKEIVDITGKQKSAIYRVAKQYGLKITAPKAWQKDDGSIAEYRRQGKSYHEIARLTGKDKRNIKLTCIRLGVERTEEEQNNERIIEKQKNLNAFVNLCESQGFEYLEGYENFRSIAVVRCKKCGNVIKKAYQCFYKRTACCQCCEQQRREALEEERKVKAQEKKEQRTLARFIKGTPQQIELKLCANCNALMLKRGAFCSESCRKKAEYRTKEHVRRIRIRGRKHDNNITLHEVYRRDKGVCYLCGELCDWNDYTEQNGVFIAGDRYPSIDHVVALASGGTHVWGNVRLAHRWCNTIKSNT